MLSKPPIVPVIGAVVELKKTGVNFSGLCPFHAEKTPSFFVRGEKYKCFGCGVSGDVIDFVMAYQGCDFLQAVKFLSIDIEHIDYSEMNCKRKLVSSYRKWESGYFQELCMLLRVAGKLVSSITPESLDRVGFIYRLISLWEYHADILQNGTDKQKYNLYRDHETYDYSINWRSQCKNSI